MFDIFGLGIGIVEQERQVLGRERVADPNQDEQVNNFGDINLCALCVSVMNCQPVSPHPHPHAILPHMPWLTSHVNTQVSLPGN